ncbi:MAG: PHP domain-containing protein [Candidatus Nezhaarchaeales archaeon]
MREALPDLHVHTRFSDGRATVDEAIKTGTRRGLSLLGICDHYDPLYMKSESELRHYIATLKAYEVARGVEISIGNELPISNGLLKELDYVIAGVHRLRGIAFWGDPTPIYDGYRFVAEMLDSIKEAVEHYPVDIIAHVTWLPESVRHETRRLITEEWIRELVLVAADRGVAIEVSGVWRVPDEEVVRECIHQGVLIATGSDAHQVSQVGELTYPRELIRRLSVNRQQIFIPRRFR